MKFNDKEIVQFSKTSKCTVEGRLAHQKPQGNDWYSQTFKERWFKLHANLLYYYRIGEMDCPAGVYVLETANVHYENSRQVPFAFSISFQDEHDKKHIFSCHSEQDLFKWVNALKNASYEYWRSQLRILQKKISMKTGKELDDYHFKQAKNLEWSKDTKGFQCHLDECKSEPKSNSSNSEILVNLIEL